MVERSCRLAGATICACRAALLDGGSSANLAGGSTSLPATVAKVLCLQRCRRCRPLHHMQAEGKGQRADRRLLRRPSGNGITASRVTTTAFSPSMIGARNFPDKEEGLDIELPDGR